MEIAESIRRTVEIEEPTNLYFIHPIAARLTPLFAALRITPNAVSLAGMGFGLMAAFAYYHYRDPRYAVAGFILMIAWHVMDGADGQLARLTHSQSELGKVLDGVCDYITFVAVYVALTASLAQQIGSWVWALAITAGVCHAIQAAAYEVQRDEYNFWSWGRTSVVLPDPKALKQRTATGRPVQTLMNFLYLQYARVQLLVAGINTESRDKLATALSSAPQQATVRQKYRELFAPAIRRWSVLSANYRTIGIFVGALLKAPQYYFGFEIFGFSTILAILLVRQHARYTAFAASLKAAG